MRAQLDDARDEPAPDLLDLARRVQRLRPEWCDPGRFYTRRDAIADALHRLARRSPETQARAPLVHPRERRLVALARGLVAENTRLRALLAAAARPPSRRRVLDDRQLVLML
jgi:hypothetical protein